MVLTVTIQSGNVPMIEIVRFVPGQENLQVMTLNELTANICEALKHYPYYVVVNGFPPIQERSHLINLARSVCVASASEPVGYVPSEDEMSFTKVYISPEQAARDGDATRYSRTHLALEPHTDSSYMAIPHELVAFQCITTDDQGGESIMAPAEDILEHLDEAVIALLREPVYTFGKGQYPIVSGSESDRLFRYYRAQIDHTAQLGEQPLSEPHQAALYTLDTLLAQTHLFHQFHLKPGQILFMHNRKVLHGRTELSPSSDRLLHRVRLHVAGLSSKGSVYIPDNADDCLGLANEFERLGRFENALECYRRASELAPNVPRILNEYGTFLLRTGQFDDAIHLFQKCAKLNAQGSDLYDSGLALSSLTHHLGNEREAQDILENVVKCYPYIMEEHYDPQKSTILRLRGFENAAYSILENSDGTYKKLLRGGHFAVTNLLDEENYNVALLNIFENNLDTLGNIPDFNLILNTIACPDSKNASLLVATKFVERYPHIPIINPPHRVLKTTREQNSLRLNTIPGISFPKTEKIWWDGGSPERLLDRVLELGFVFPFIVREVGSQTGQSVALIKDEASLRTYFESRPIPQAYYAIQFKDCAFQGDRVFRKMRIFFIDGTLYPVANVFNDTWNIHSGDRYSIMDQSTWMQDEEKLLLEDPYGYIGSDNFNRLHDVRDLIGLDFFGIDFTILEDKSLFIFELNAAMRHNFGHVKNFPYTEPYLIKISNAFETMIKERLSVTILNRV
jgi:tetratricopeptide (TPR) repeat protein